nr:ribonuclease H-like domain-containing protein [Tanacetum cinerariifolium]
MRIPLLYRGEYSQWVERFMNYLKEQTDEKVMINSIKNGDQPLPRVTQVSIAGTTSTEQPPLKDKSMWSDQEKRVMEAIEKRFRSNAATKKTHRNLLKQLYENFTASNSEMLDQTFDRLQKLNTHVVVWRNKSDLDTMSMDDLYNNLKVFEPEVKGMSSSNSSAQNIAFVSSSNNNSTNGAVNTTQVVNTANEVSTTDTQVNTANIDNLSDAVICAFLASQPSSPQLVNEDLEQIHPDDLEEMDLKWQMAMLTIRAKRFLKNTGWKLNLNGNETVAFDKTKGKTRRNMPVETTNSSSLVSCNGLGGYDWSDQAEEGPNYALITYFTSSSDSEDWGAGAHGSVSEGVCEIRNGFGVERYRQDHKVKLIRCDNETELKNRDLNQFYEMNGIMRQYSVARTPQQNGVAKRRNKTLIKAARTMLADSKLPTTFWAKVVNTACYVQNRPDVAGTQSNGNAGTKDNNNTEPKCSQDDGFKPSNDVGKKVNEVPIQENKCKDQEEKDSVNSTNRVNAVSLTVNATSNEVNVVDRKSSIKLLDDPNMPELEDINIFT